MSLNKLQEILGVKFNNVALLKEAYEIAKNIVGK